MNQEVLDRPAVDAFAARTMQIINDGALALMMSVGHRTRLFDVMAGLPPATVGEIARRARLNDRYVREWLGAMVTGRIVEFDAAAETYHLAPEKAACLTRAASPGNVAVTSQWISVLGTAEDAVIDAFHHGRGVPYSAYPRFHEVMAEESRQTVIDGLLAHILPLAEGAEARLESGIDVLDVACGSGGAIVALATAFPRSRFTGVDVSAEAIASANAAADAQGLPNVRFVQADVADLPHRERYDFVTAFDAIHDQGRPAQVLRNVYEALRPDGVFLMQDIAGHSDLRDNLSHPLAPFLYTISCLHCMSVSLAAGGPGLGAMWGRELALKMLAAAGFGNVHVDSLPHDPINFYYIAVKGR